MNLFQKIRDKIHATCKKSKNRTIPKRPYKDGKYRMSWHSIDRMNDRKITKGAVHVNLHTTPLKKTGIYYDKQGRPTYRRFGYNRIVTGINPKTNVVATTYWYHTRDYDKYLKEKPQHGKIFTRSRQIHKGIRAS